ncbi:hypothetical protein [Rhodoferax koreensis]|uniref:hypothetical protein n=1 Tax=Rhodoferax koreensis TaxID=1842727 RepID=UPI0012FFCBB2|nr:hypothetical protein [Rhodoferax koreense]
MIAWLSPKTWIALGLAAFLIFTHAFIYRAGKASVRADWDRSTIAQQQAAASAESENRRLETLRQSRVIEAQNAATKRTQAFQAAYLAVDAERRRLLDLASAPTASNVPGQPEAAGDRATASIRSVLGACTAEVQELGRAADQHASDVKMLLEAWPR